MGVSIKYNAIPIDSSLYARIQQEKPLCYLVNNLTIYGGGLFSFFDIDLDETQEILEGMIEACPEIFGSQVQADLIISNFRSEIYKTRQNYPEIEFRTALIEKSFDDIEQCLAKEFSRRHVQNSDELVKKLMMGDQLLAPNLLTEKDHPIAVVSRTLIQEGARILDLIEPDNLQIDVPYWNEWGLKHLKTWRNLYLAVSERNEVILISSE
jgi:hypothetical protein